MPTVHELTEEEIKAKLKSTEKWLAVGYRVDRKRASAKAYGTVEGVLQSLLCNLILPLIIVGFLYHLFFGA